MNRPTLLLAAAALVVAACSSSASPVPSAPSSASPSGGSAAPSAGGTAAPTAGAGTRPIVIDTDLAADDIFAIMVLLRDPTVDLRAITIAGTGEVRCPAGLRNARRLVAAFGRTNVPVACGRENPGPSGRWFPAEWRDGADAFYGIGLPVVDGEGDRGRPAAKLLVDLASAARVADAPLTLVVLGPWTNLADAVALEPAFVRNLAGIHAMGGAIDVPGNITVGDTTPADGVEWNLGADPDAVAAVLALDVPVTFVPLDATNDVPVPADILDQLAADHGAAGADIAFEMYARSPYLSTSGNDYWDTLAAVLLQDSSIARWADVTVRTQTSGTGAGRLVRDPAGRTVRAAMGADRDAFLAAFMAALRRGAPRPEPFTIAGALSVRWDGTTCRIEGTPPSKAGVVRVTLTNDSTAPGGLLGAGVKAPKTWPDALAFIRAADFSDPNFVVPDWIIPVQGSLFAEAGKVATAFLTFPAGEVGVVCATGEWPKFDLFDAGSFTVGG
jgi:inosine-uridine nucleoside N-ribohydrolase